jgi:hypothetical protein
VCTQQNPTPISPTITVTQQLSAGVATYKAMMSWRAAALASHATGRRNAQLTLDNGTGTVVQYTLTAAWPIDVNVSEVPAGSTEVIDFTVTLLCEQLQPV